MRPGCLLNRHVSESHVSESNPQINPIESDSMHRRSVLAVSLFVPIVLVVAGCSSSGTSADAEGKSGGTLTIGLEANYSTLNPFKSSSVVAHDVMMQIYGHLMYPTADGGVKPGLALSYESNADSTEYTIKLRKGVKFQDGTDFNADAVKFTLDKQRNPDTGSPYYGHISDVTSVTAPDEYTVVLTLAEPNSAIASTVIAGPPGMIVSPTAYKKFGKDYDHNPVGAGPFKFASEVPGNTVKLEKWDGYWQKGKPKLDGVTFKVMPDAQTRYTSLKSGVIQLARFMPDTQTRKVKSSDDVEVVEKGWLGTQFMMMNTEKAPFNDVRVRRAMIMATDRTGMNKAINGGSANIDVESPFTEASPYYPGKVSTYPEYNPEKAKELLKEVGTPIEFTLETSSDPHYLKIATAMQKQFEKVGAKVNIVSFDQPTSIQLAHEHDFQAMIYRWRGETDPDANSYTFFHSQYATPNTPSLNYGLFSDPKVDTLLQEGRAEKDVTKRKSIYKKVAEQIALSAPYDYLWAGPVFRIQKKGLANLPKTPDQLDYLFDTTIK